MLTFEELFRGGELAHGTWSPELGGVTHEGPVSTENYQAHLEGKVGLGLVPVRLDGTCRFAAIDIDNDQIDHRDLYLQVAARKMPLHVCRSKSGGAHLYLFTKEPGIKASQLMVTLRRWATALGYPTAEVFPKQPKISSKNVGSWLNLPYYKADLTTRYCVGLDGALTLEEFLLSVQFYQGLELVDDTVPTRTGRADLPPCLQKLTEGGLHEGHRNQVLFNLGVFYRKSSPQTWKEQLEDFNQTDTRPPLGTRDLRSIQRSVDRTRYQYTCNQEPLTSCCNRGECLKLPFGVGHMPWQEEGTYDELTPSHLRKVLTDPPRYILEVNGLDTELTWEELFDHKMLRRRLNQVHDLLLPPMKADRWDGILKELLKHKVDVPAPKDASGRGLLLSRCLEFLTLANRATKEEDLLKGLPVMNQEKVLFRIGDLQKYLAAFKQEKIDTTILFQLVYSEGGDAIEMTIKGRKVSVWRLPREKLNLQTEDFTPPELEPKKEPLF